MLTSGILACTAAAQGPASNTARWTELSRYEIKGWPGTLFVDDGGPAVRAPIRTVHWRIVFDRPLADRAIELRYVDLVDCGRGRRQSLLSERFAVDGTLVSRTAMPRSSSRWEPLTGELIQDADGYGCINSAEAK